MPSLQMPENQTRDLTCRELTLRHESIDEKNRSFEAVVSTETPATVFDYRSWEYIEEILVADGGNFPSRMVLLDDHQRHNGTKSVIGSALDFTLAGNKWQGRGVVGRAVDGNIEREQLWQDVADGHIRAVSIGYMVNNYVDIPAGQTQTINGRSYTASDQSSLRISTDWTVHELSLTPIGADSEALIRSKRGASPELKRKGYFAR